MVFQKGHKFGKGKKGASGRKSAGEELCRARLLDQAWFEEGVDPNLLKEKVEKALKGGEKLRLYDLYLLKGIKSEKILMDMSKKVFPDKQEHSGNVNFAFSDWVQKINKKDDEPKK